MDKNGDFWTTYPPHLVHVVIERPHRRNQLEQELSEKKALVTKRETNVKTVSQELIKVIDVLSGISEQISTLLAHYHVSNTYLVEKFHLAYQVNTKLYQT